MDKTFPENIKDIRTAVMASEVREGIAQGMEYVEQFANTATTKAAEAAASAKTAADAAGKQGAGLTDTTRALLLTLFENAAYKSNTMRSTLNALRAEWESSTETIPVQSVTLSSSTLALSEGESQTLTATVLPANATDRTVVWSVSPAGFATVVNGEVTASKAGSCTVTATAGGKSASCAVTVKTVETEIPVQSVSLSSSTLTLNEGASKTLTATVLPANATNKTVTWGASPAGFVTVANGVVTGSKAGTCTVTATAGGKSAQCVVTVAEVETAQLIYSLPQETVLSAAAKTGLDTGLKLLEHASTETPQYTILLDAKAGDAFDANTWPAFLHCLTETGSTSNLPGFNSTSSPLNKKTEFAYYNYGGVTLSDSIEHFKTRTRYAVQIDGRKYRGGSTYCPLTEWMTTNGTIVDVPQTFLIGAAQSADGSKKQQFWDGTVYQCRVYKGLLSDNKVNEYIQKGW